MRSRNWSRTLTERSGGNGAVAVFMACYDCFFVQSMPRASKQQARYAVGRCLMLWSSNDVTQQGSRLPDARKRKYNWDRKSQVLVKKL
ncbi:hypothetical protein KNHN1_14380 [Pseudomonas guariconensis]